MKGRLTIVAVVAVAAGAAFFTLRRPGPEPKWDVATKDSALIERAKALSPYHEGVISQSNPSACGPTSVDNVAHSVGGAFKSPCTFGFCMGGMTLDELGISAADPKWNVTVLRDLTLDQFRDELRHVNDPRRRYVLNFHRGPIFGAGGGHHSPLGAYLEQDDLVYVLDVNSRYGPWLVKTDKLFAAMDTVDKSTGKKRGLLRFELR